MDRTSCEVFFFSGLEGTCVFTGRLFSHSVQRFFGK